MTTPQPARGRILALRLVAAGFVLFGLITANLSLSIPFVVWLPDQQLLAMGTAPSDLDYVVQETALIDGYLVMFACFALQVRRPAANVAALWLIIAFLGPQMIVDAVRWNIGNPNWFLIYAVVVVTVVLHPRRAAPLRPIDPVAMAIAAIGAVPAVVFAGNELRQQFALPTSAENNHFALAQMAMLTVVAAAIGATSVPGRRIGVVAATAIPVMVGICSMMHPSAAVFALPLGWAWAVIAWGLAVLAADRRHLVTLRRTRAQAAAVQEAP